MATAAGAAALLYYTLNRKLQTQSTIDEDHEENGSHAPTDVRLGVDRVTHMLIQAPAIWLETISTLSNTPRFTYSETLGNGPLGIWCLVSAFFSTARSMEDAYREF